MQIDGYDHQTGRHCGATALSNLADFYDWGYDEAACFGYAGGFAQRYPLSDGRPWRTFFGSEPGLETIFFDTLEIPHRVREGDSWAEAWDDVTTTLADEHPVLLAVDPDELPYLIDETHPGPHLVVAIGYDDQDVVLSDGARHGTHSIPHDTLRTAWDLSDPPGWTNRHTAVTRPRHLADETDAAASATRNVAAHVLRPLEAPRSTAGPGEEGLPALRAFAEDVPTWAELADPVDAIRPTIRTIDWHGEGSACRELYADSLEDLGRRIGLPNEIADRLRDVAVDWHAVRDLLESATTASGEEPASQLAEAGSRLGDIADREERIFEDIDDALRGG